jgi:hypothetical protein
MIGKINGTREGIRRGKNLMDDFKEKRRYRTLNKETIDLSLWRTCV